jgi:hypothetical protein
MSTQRSLRPAQRPRFHLPRPINKLNPLSFLKRYSYLAYISNT